MVTSIKDSIKVINSINGQITTKDKELDNTTNVRDYNRISDEIACLYIKLSIEAQNLVSLADIATETY